MNSENNNEINLAKWLSGELSPEEKHAFEQSDDYKAYAKIINATEKLNDPAYDEDAALAKVKEKLAAQSKVKKLNLNYIFAAAAALVILFGLYFFMNNATSTFQTSYGQQLAMTLPDGSEVLLNAQSKLYYDTDNWEKNRTLHLNGEAYFKVTKGSPFKVVTKEGTVEVLGTQFNVDTNKNFFEVSCYSGKVKVTNDQKTERILTKGNAHRTYNNIATNWNFDPTNASWITGQNTFRETPFLQVIDALEDQYQIEIKNSEAFKNEQFTGHFTNDDRTVALKTVFEAMDIEYTVNANVVTLSKK